MSNPLARSLLTALSPLAVSIALAGCSNQPVLLQPDGVSETSATVTVPEPAYGLVAPPADARAGFFPLEIGNRWRYRGRIIEEVIPDDSKPSRTVRHYRLRSALICRETIAGRPYIVAREVLHLEGTAHKQWIRYRQDRSGLFEADLSTGTPPSCDRDALASATTEGGPATPSSVSSVSGDAETQAAYERAYVATMAKLELARRLVRGGDVEGVGRDRHISPEGFEIGELKRLEYPLHVGARWVIRRDPRFVSHVVAHERLELPAGRLAGWKVRIRSELFGPDDRVLFWVGHKGFLQYDIRVAGLVTDPRGAVIGRIALRDHRELVGDVLPGPGHSGDPHPEPTTARVE